MSEAFIWVSGLQLESRISQLTPKTIEAGDTAQCISKDSAFRFPEIKSLFYEYYEVIANELKQPSFAKPVQFSLAKNYRPHQGILSFASWVMQLLWNGKLYHQK